MAVDLPRAADLNRRINIRLQTDVPNASFGVDQTFDTGLQRWAKKEPIHSLTLRDGANTGEAPTDLFWVRWGAGTKPADLTASHVIDFDGRRYRVLDTIDVDDLHQFTRISAKDLGAI